LPAAPGSNPLLPGLKELLSRLVTLFTGCQLYPIRLAITLTLVT
jgi:hypothetical protein